MLEHRGTLFSMNNLGWSSIIYAGQVLKLSGAAAEIKSMITATAKSMGVDPALALAFGEQEPSFRQNVVSSAGAIGVMQVIPRSGTWASRMVCRQLDLHDTRTTSPRDWPSAGSW
ncbi:transglycosylase SLT domain-containing protein [Pseudarthrobacter enclensis]|uniref:Soluble lytic murein transglycosylase-like protein n=1 Tax=Pseudarthrobacter enclensis TaxID=993070 RepID=A0ABT9S0A2_9MICC|nr:transglycosylase SLT domain-containing protein [Pseudarthrobacter enclensis]MDP9890742.1 soluble lytic murein transglycosylase-like protein [Pseudarthrobacter enclensis]